MKKITLLLLLFLVTKISIGQLWEQSTAFPGQLRHSSGSFTLNNFGFIVGGYGSNNQVLDDVWKFDATTETWQQMNDAPIGLYGASFFVVNDTAYMINGWDSTLSNANDSLYRYDELTDSWSAISQYPGTPSYTCISFVLNNKVYIGIGYSPLTNELWEYEPSTNTWTSKANFPSNLRQNCTSFVLNNIAYVGLGASSFSAYDDIYSYDPLADQWTLVGTFPGGGRYATTSFVINNKAYVGCGSDLNNFYNDVWEFDPSTLQWTQLNDFAGTERLGCNYFVINGIGYAGLGRSAVFESGFWKFIPQGLNEIRGFAYRDQNQNSIFDAGDIAEKQLIVEVNPGGKLYTTNSLGFFKIPADTQVTYTMSILNIPNNYSLSGINNPVSFTSTGNIDSNNVYILTPNSTQTDASVHLSAITPMRPGFDGFYSLTYRNQGTTLIDSVLLKLHINDQLYYLQTIPGNTPVYLSTTNDTIHWMFYNLQPGETKSILVKFQNSITTGSLGDSIPAYAEISSFTTEIDTTNNYSTYIDTLVGSFDPNDISVSSTTLTPVEVAAEKWLTYKIRFQNTGTYQANYVRINDSIPSELNLSSFEFLAASHQPCTFTIEGNQVVKFDFPGIILPDSNSNEPASHGFIEYRIKPKSNLVIGDVISNRAYIYFDFNPAVITNDAITTVESATSLQEIQISDESIRLYPNPSSEFIRCKLINSATSEGNYKLSIYDTQGKVNLESNEFNTNNPINIKMLPKGLYLVMLINESGDQYSGTFIKQ